MSNEDTQKTPASAEIPVPKRRDVLRDLKKVAKPVKPSDRGEGSADEEQGE